MGARQVEKAFRPRLEYVGVHTALPCCQILEAPRPQFVAQRLGTDHAAYRGAMEAMQGPIRKFDGNGEARAQVLGELGVVRGREPHLVPLAVAPRRQPQGSLSGNVQSLGRKFGNATAHDFSRQQRQPDFRVSGAGNAAKVLRREHADVMAEAAEPLSGLRQRTHHTVGLGKPGIGNDHDSHDG